MGRATPCPQFIALLPWHHSDETLRKYIIRARLWRVTKGGAPLPFDGQGCGFLFAAQSCAILP